MTEKNFDNQPGMIAKLLHSKNTGEDVTLNADEVREFFEFAARSLIPVKKEKDFDELAAEINGEPIKSDENHFTDEFLPEMPSFQIKFFQNEKLENLESQITDFVDKTGNSLMGLSNLEFHPSIGFFISLMFRKQPQTPA